MTREHDNVSSQAGLASLRDGQAVNGSPAPGEPGSRFNPNVVERGSRTGQVPIYGPADESPGGPRYEARSGDVPIYGSDAPKGQASAAAGIRSVMARRDRINATRQSPRDYTPPTLEAPEQSGADLERQ